MVDCFAVRLVVLVLLHFRTDILFLTAVDLPALGIAILLVDQRQLLLVIF